MPPTRADELARYDGSVYFDRTMGEMSRERRDALMEGTPLHLSLDEIGRSIAAVERVRSVHDLHIWTLSSDRIALSAHLVLDHMSEWERVLPAVSTLLAERYESTM